MGYYKHANLTVQNNAKYTDGNEERNDMTESCGES